jgi:hypothetical protein
VVRLKAGATTDRKGATVSCAVAPAVPLTVSDAAPITPPWIIVAWRVVVTLATLALIGVWHVSLLWLHRDEPSVLAGLLAVVFVTLLIARRFARRIAPGDRGRLARHTARLNRTGVAFAVFLLVLLLLFHLGFQRAGSDGRAYFVQVRSLVMDGDLDFTNDEAVFGGRGARQYAFGAPLLWSPFFVAGHAWILGLNALGGHFSADGYTYPYQRAIGLATLLYGFIGLVLIYRVLRAYYPRGMSALATLGLCSTSFLIWYLTAENSMVHGVSMFSTTLFLFLWHRFRREPTLGQWTWLGAAAGLMATVRWQDGVFAVLPVADLLWTSWRAGGSTPLAARLRQGARNLAGFGAACVLTFSPQLVFWKAVFGSPTHVPSREHGFDPGWIPPFLTDVLFSANHGLLSWTPVVALSLIGLVLFARDHGRVALVLAGGFLGQLWVNGAVEIWWGGTGFGARRFANSALVFAVGLAALLAMLQRRPLVAPVAALLALLFYNTAFMLGVRDGSLPAGEGVTFASVTSELHNRFGNPFSFPVGAYVAWRYDVGLAAYDRLRGWTYNNVTIDVGASDDEPFLGRGWSAREAAGGVSYRWSEGDDSVVLVPLKTNADDYLLELEWAPLLDPALRRQVVEIAINDAAVASVTVGPDLHTDRVTVPARVLRANFNQVRFRYRYALSPRDLGHSDDPRRLAVRVSTITLKRVLRE